MINTEKAEQVAINCFKAAKTIGTMINEIDSMAREGWQAIKDEQEAYETIIIDGAKVSIALREIAMRLDRSALIKSDITPSPIDPIKTNGH